MDSQTWFRYQIRFAVAVLYQRIRKIDFSSAVLFEAVPLAAVHCDRIFRLYDSIDKSVRFLCMFIVKSSVYVVAPIFLHLFK